MTMKQIALFLSIFCFTNSFFAQTLSPEVISSAGTEFTNGSNSLSWTLGEPVTSTLTNNTVVTQGFHQDNLIISGIDSPKEPDGSGIAVFPNPVSDIVLVQIKSNADEQNSLELYDADGKLLLTRQMTSQLGEISMMSYPSGTYILKVRGSSLKSYKIIKTK